MKKDKAQPKKATVIRTKVGTEYSASGYGRGVNKRNVYIINGYYYAHHPQYAKQAFTPCEGDLKGYVRVNRFSSGTFYAVNESEHTHVAVTPQPKEVKHTQGEMEIVKRPIPGTPKFNYIGVQTKDMAIQLGTDIYPAEGIINEMNAAELVKRWNLFPELVEELEKYRSFIAEWKDCLVGVQMDEGTFKGYNLSGAALLKKAKGE